MMMIITATTSRPPITPPTTAPAPELFSPLVESGEAVKINYSYTIILMMVAN